MSNGEQKPAIIHNETGTVAEELATQVAAGSTIVRLENMTQMAVSVQRPRNNKAVLAEAMEVLVLSPALVESAIYSKPVGKDKDTGKMKYAEGLSIRAAEELRRIYGNNSAGTTVIRDEPTEVIIGAAFVDFEKNTRYAAEKAVSKLFRTREGRIQEIPPDRLADVVVPAHASKLLREVILRSIPSWLKAEFERRAREIGQAGSLVGLRQRTLERFSTLGVTEAQLLAHFGKEAVSKISRDDIATMHGIYTAISEGETTVQEVFGATATAATARPQSQAEVTGQKTPSSDDWGGLWVQTKNATERLALVRRLLLQKGKAETSLTKPLEEFTPKQISDLFSAMLAAPEA